MNDRYVSHGPLSTGHCHNHLHKINPPLHKLPRIASGEPYREDITETGGQKAPQNDRPRTRASFGDVFISSQR